MVDINKEVTVVIISYKSKKKIINLIKQISNDLKIIVIENSHDKSIKKDLSNLTRNIQLKFSENNGYGSAINLARKDVNTKYFFVLNPDIQKIDENFFLYFEETDYCFRSNKNNHKIYQINSQRVYHDIGTSVETKSENEANELKKLYIWHFIWSKFYYYKKCYSFSIALIIFIPIILRIIFRITLASIFNNTDKKEKYLVRLNGLIASIRGMQSYKRLEK